MGTSNSVLFEISPLSIHSLTRTRTHPRPASCLLVRMRGLKKPSFLNKRVHEMPERKCAATVVGLLKKKKAYFQVNIAINREENFKE